MPLAASNPKVQRLRRLARRRSARRDEGAFVLEGPVAVAEAIATGAPLELVFVATGTPALVPERSGVPVVEVDAEVLSRCLSTVTPQPVAAICRTVDVAIEQLAGASFVVVLAGVADPGNAGTLVRSAAASGADAVVLTEGSVDVYNPKVVRAAAGTLFRVPVVIAADPAALRSGLGLPLVGAAARDGMAIGDADLTGPLALVLGSEAHGLPDGLALDRTVTIPLAGGVESLNVAMAGTVLCFEVARQRGLAGPPNQTGSRVAAVATTVPGR